MTNLAELDKEHDKQAAAISIKTINAEVINEIVPDHIGQAISLQENEGRVATTAKDVAELVTTLRLDYEMTIAQIKEKLGVPQRIVSEVLWREELTPEVRKAAALTLHCPGTDYCQYDTRCLTYDGDDENSDPDFMKVSDCDVIDEDFTTDCLSKYPQITLQAGLEKSNYIAYLLPESKKISEALSLSEGWSNYDTIIGPQSLDPTDIASNTYLNGEWGYGDSGMLYPGMAYIIYSANGGVLTQVMGE